MEGPKEDRPTAAGETEPRAARARTAESQLELRSQKMIKSKSISLPPFTPVFGRKLKHPCISEDTSI